MPKTALVGKFSPGTALLITAPLSAIPTKAPTASVAQIGIQFGDSAGGTPLRGNGPERTRELSGIARRRKRSKGRMRHSNGAPLMARCLTHTAAPRVGH